MLGKNQMNQIVQCYQKKVHRERAVSARLIYRVGVQNEATGSDLAGKIRQLVTRDDSKPAYLIHKP